MSDEIAVAMAALMDRADGAERDVVNGTEDPRVQGDTGKKGGIAPMSLEYDASRGIQRGAVAAPFTHLA